MKILLVEDDKELASLTSQALERFNHSVRYAENGEDALLFHKSEDFDAIVLDLTLPDIKGEDILGEIRKTDKKIPIIILTAKHGLSTRVSTLDSGADDYLTKPFALKELEARLRVIVRRGNFANTSKIKIGNFEYDSSSKKVFVQGMEIRIPRKELILLDYLLLKQGKVVSVQKIMDRLYNLENDIEPKVISLYIHRLKKRLVKANSFKILNMKGLGYILETSRKDSFP